MAFYVRRGEVPKHRHTQFRGPNGKLYHEQHVSREGFSDVFSNMYHIYAPTAVKKVGEFKPFNIEEAKEPHRHHHWETNKLSPGGDWLTGRKPFVFNQDVVMYTAAPTKTGDYFYRNGLADEVYFIHKGAGVFETIHGHLVFGEGDYVVIPRGVTYRVRSEADETKLFIVESTGPCQVPKHFRNKHGQIEDYAPYCERDFRVPEYKEAVDEKGEFPLLLKIRGGFQEMTLDHHPFDVIGWDGFHYPWIFNINDYMPKVGKVHLPPPTHLTFTGPGYVLCSFCPRIYDFHELAVPIPYVHSNVDSDEILYYVDGDFMSRKGISNGSITLHPSGIPHGPQPGLAEKALNAKETHELAVMVDTFRPLKVAAESMAVDDPKYPYSWLED